MHFNMFWILCGYLVISSISAKTLKQLELDLFTYEDANPNAEADKLTVLPNGAKSYTELFLASNIAMVWQLVSMKVRNATMAKLHSSLAREAKLTSTLDRVKRNAEHNTPVADDIENRIKRKSAQNKSNPENNKTNNIQNRVLSKTKEPISGNDEQSPTSVQERVKDANNKPNQKPDSVQPKVNPTEHISEHHQSTGTHQKSTSINFQPSFVMTTQKKGIINNELKNQPTISHTESLSTIISPTLTPTKMTHYPNNQLTSTQKTVKQTNNTNTNSVTDIKRNKFEAAIHNETEQSTEEIRSSSEQDAVAQHLQNKTNTIGKKAKLIGPPEVNPTNDPVNIMVYIDIGSKVGIFAIIVSLLIVILTVCCLVKNYRKLQYTL